MAKKQTFADKLSKHKTVMMCPVCNEAVVPTLVLRPAEGKTDGQRMKETRLGVCKCNRKEVYG